MSASVTTYYLEMVTPQDLRAAYSNNPELQVLQAQVPCPLFNRFLYEVVGKAWSWTDKLNWSEKQWLDYVCRSELQTWVAYLSGTPAGYFELEKQSESVEIAYFGLLPQFIGRGIGSHLLTRAIEQAWQMQAQRVWVHTCTLDHPNALSNYQARGFHVFKQETA
ncbi:MAG TPA: GNAT family N-acetyltransferase [Abditibacteriaceae bacterium]|jgi:GNAT superfamily N-acetyltransferase